MLKLIFLDRSDKDLENRLKQGQLLISRKIVSVFKHKRSVPLVVVEPINKEPDRLETLGVISPRDYWEWSAPIVYAKMKNNILAFTHG